MIKRFLALLSAAVLIGLCTGPSLAATAATTGQSTASFVIQGNSTPQPPSGGDEDGDSDPTPGTSGGTHDLGVVNPQRGTLGTTLLPTSSTGTASHGFLPALGSTASLLLMAGVALLSMLGGAMLGRALSRQEVATHDH